MPAPTGKEDLHGYRFKGKTYFNGHTKSSASRREVELHEAILLPEEVVYGVLGLTDKPRIPHEEIPPNTQTRPITHTKFYDPQGHYLGGVIEFMPVENL